MDDQLNNSINETEKRLEILNREKELREQGYSWDEINQIIQDEYGTQIPFVEDHNMMDRHVGRNFGHDDGFCGWVK